MTAIKKSSKTSKEKLSTTDDILAGQNNGRLGTDGRKYRKKTQQGGEGERSSGRSPSGERGL